MFTYLPTLTININKMHVGKYTEPSLLDGSWGGMKFMKDFSVRDVYRESQPAKPLTHATGI